MRTKIIFFSLAFFFFSFPGVVEGQALKSHEEEIARAKIIAVINDGEETISGVTLPTQTLSVKIISGTHTDEIIELKNNYIQLREGETFYLRITTYDNKSFYDVFEPDRRAVLIGLTLLFLLLSIIIGGRRGSRGILALLIGVAVVVFVLLPGIINGHSPALFISIAIGTVVIAGSYITHGFNWTTTAAVLGMSATILLVAGLSYLVIHLAHFSGLASDEAIYLTFNTEGSINLRSLLLGGYLIGFLGVLYDGTIGQAVSVRELFTALKKSNREKSHDREVFMRATVIGREHIGALVNSLALAYLGASLPLLLLFYSGNTDFGPTLSQEVVAEEIARILIGSIGLILSVPLTTWISIKLLKNKDFSDNEEKGGARHSHTH